MKKLLVAVAMLGIAVMTTNSLTRAADDDKPKVTIKQVMKKAMKGGLCKKVASGKGSAAEKKELVALFTGMAKNKPPKGDADSWKEKTDALVKASTAVHKGEEGAGAKLIKAADCKSCHSKHKGK